MIPSKRFYFLRHGKTDANERGLTCGGEWDISLNAEGVSQAEKLSVMLAHVDFKINAIFCSPMKRAQETARLINSHLKAPIYTIEELREWCVGEWETKPWGEVPNPFNTTIDPPLGETRAFFEQRIERAVANVLSNFSGTPLFVSHGAAAHALFTVLGTDKIQIENCTLYSVNPGELKWSLQKALK
jgi:probable phosphoglycerate mutase